MARIAKILRLVLREALLPRDLYERVPEQSVMRSPESIAGFDAAGQVSLLPIYHFNARAIAALAKRNSHVLDLGSGSGRFLAYLAQHRPDLRITGVDLSEDMIHVGQEMLARSGLASRVRLRCGDMRNLSDFISDPADLVSSVFALHHLDTPADLAVCLDAVSRIVAAGSSLWIFDHVRPRRQRTAVEFPSVFTPNAEDAFCRDSSNSLGAAWSYDELATALRVSGLAGASSVKARLMPLYQSHWIAALRQNGDDAEWVNGKDLPPKARSEARQFERLFRFSPQRKCGRIV